MSGNLLGRAPKVNVNSFAFPSQGSFAPRPQAGHLFVPAGEASGGGIQNEQTVVAKVAASAERIPRRALLFLAPFKYIYIF